MQAAKALLDLNITEHLQSSDISTINSTANTIDVLNAVKDSLTGLNVPSNVQDLAASANEVLGLNLAPIDQTELSDRIATIHYLESTAIPDVTDRMDEINAAKANVDFILGLSDLPSQAELAQVDNKVQQLASFLPSWQEMTSTINDLKSRVQALEPSGGGGGTTPSPTYFTASEALVTDLNLTTIIVTLPEVETYTATGLSADQFTVSSSLVVTNVSMTGRYLYVTLDNYVPTGVVLTLTLTGTPIANSQGHIFQLSSFSVSNQVNAGNKLVAGRTYSTNSLCFEASEDSIQEIHSKDTFTFNPTHGVYTGDGGKYIHLATVSGDNFTGTMKLGEASELATFNRIVTTLEPESVTVHHLEPNKVEIVFPSGSYTISENNGFSVPGKNVIDGSLNGNVLTLVLDADVSVEDVLHVTMCDGTITNDGVSVSLDSVPVTNNTVESWLVIEEDSTVANFPKVQAQTKRAARFWKPSWTRNARQDPTTLALSISE